MQVTEFGMLQYLVHSNRDLGDFQLNIQCEYTLVEIRGIYESR